jgi:cupin superfamily acireductone dioxygenase involved in methionine salvage
MEQTQQYITDRLHHLKWDLRYEKYRNSKLANELEASELHIMDLLKEIRELENRREFPRKEH